MSEKRKYVRYVTAEKLEAVDNKNKLLIKKYFSFKNMNLSESSKKSYESDFNQWLVFIHEKFKEGDLHSEYILDIVEDDVEDMVDLLEDFMAFCTSVLGNNERRIQRRMASISSFFLYLRKKRKIKENPLDFLDRPKVRVGEKVQIKQTFLTKEQVEEIRKQLKKEGDLQLTTFFEVALSTMGRVNALSNIKIKQIDFEQNRILDVLEKEGKFVTLFPSKKAVTHIKNLLALRKSGGVESEYLFITKYGGEIKKVSKGTIQTQWVKRIGRLVNIPELHAHDLRHSGSNLLFHSGLSLENVSLLLNHSGTDVTRNHYLQVNLDAVQDEKAKLEI